MLSCRRASSRFRFINATSAFEDASEVILAMMGVVKGVNSYIVANPLELSSPYAFGVPTYLTVEMWRKLPLWLHHVASGAAQPCRESYDPRFMNGLKGLRSQDG